MFKSRLNIPVLSVNISNHRSETRSGCNFLWVCILSAATRQVQVCLLAHPLVKKTTTHVAWEGPINAGPTASIWGNCLLLQNYSLKVSGIHLSCDVSDECPIQSCHSDRSLPHEYGECMSTSLSLSVTSRRSLHCPVMRRELDWVRDSPSLSSWISKHHRDQAELGRTMQTGQRGTVNSNTCWLRWASVWAWGMCGGSHTSATKMEEVSVYPKKMLNYGWGTRCIKHGQNIASRQHQDFPLWQWLCPVLGCFFWNSFCPLSSYMV